METPASFEVRNAPSSYPANTQEPNPCRTPSRESGPSELERVREAARRNRKLQPYPSARFDVMDPR
jgi:hypothetical protein